MAECIHMTFQSVTGEELEGRKWIPDGDVKGIVQLVHGMAEHIDRYDETGHALADAGWLTVGHTCLGHGPKAKRLGWFAEKNGWQALIDDVHALRQKIAAEYPGLPYVVLGHSMGSFVTRCYLTQYGNGLAGGALSGTGHYDKLTVKAGLGIAKLVCLFGGAKKPSPLINAIGFAPANKPFEPARTPFDWLSADAESVDRYIADPYCGFLFTGAGYRDMFTGLERMTQVEKLKDIPADLPVLFFSGAKDPIGNMGTGMRKVADEFKTAGITNVTVRLYPGKRHEMFHEDNRAEAWTDLIDWLNNECAAK